MLSIRRVGFGVQVTACSCPLVSPWFMTKIELYYHIWNVLTLVVILLYYPKIDLCDLFDAREVPFSKVIYCSNNAGLLAGAFSQDSGCCRVTLWLLNSGIFHLKGTAHCDVLNCVTLQKRVWRFPWYKVLGFVIIFICCVIFKNAILNANTMF